MPDTHVPFVDKFASGTVPCTIKSLHNEPAYNEVVEDAVYNEDAYNPDMDQIVWVTPLCFNEILVITKLKGLFP